MFTVKELLKNKNKLTGKKTEVPKNMFENILPEAF